MDVFFIFKITYVAFFGIILVLELLKYLYKSRKHIVIAFFPLCLIGTLACVEMTAFSFLIKEEESAWFILLSGMLISALGYLHCLVSFSMDIQERGICHRGFLGRKTFLEYSRIEKAVLEYGGTYLYVDGKRYLVSDAIGAKKLAQLITELKKRKIPFRYSYKTKGGKREL